MSTDITPVRLWIDDLRATPAEYTHTATTSAAAIAVLTDILVTGAPLTSISFDHDLGGDDTTRPVMLWMIENNVWPTDIRLHTANPVGRDWLQSLIGRYAPETCKLIR
jgi:hypothetical protein